MSLIKKILFVFFILLPISNIFVQNAYANFIASGDTLSTSNYEIRTFNVSSEEGLPRDVAFSNDGKKMFVVGEAGRDVNEYTLSTAFNVSTAVFIDSFSVATEDTNPMSLKFNNDGSKMFIGGRQNDKVYEYSLSINFDVSSATHTGNSIDVSAKILKNLFGLAFNNDGTMMYVTDGRGGGGSSESVHQYSLNISFDFSGGANFIRSADLEALNDTGAGEKEPYGMAFNQDGTRMFLIGTLGNDVNQYTLSEGFNISTASFDGGVNRSSNPNGIAFSPSGLKMFIVGTDHDQVKEHHLPCPFNLFAGKCPPITENKDRTGIAMAQIEIAKRTIDQSTDTTLNRLKWIRRNKDKQNLTNLNIDFNFNNQRLASLTEVIKTSANNKKTARNKKDHDVFYWSEGSIAIGRVGDTSISSTKKIDSNRITLGADKFISNKALRGLAFSVGRNNVDVGTKGSNLDTDTYNITYYDTTPIKDDTKFLDKIFGFGKLNSDLLTVLDGKKLTADRSGHQLYGTIRIKDEIEKNNFTFIPSGRFDIGHTMLGSYEETGQGAIAVDKQHIRTRKIRAGLAAIENLSNNQYTFKRHGKIEYVADIERSSDFKYNYVSDGGTKFNDKLYSGALHNINGEIGVDIILPENFSIFLIYERNQALGVGHTDNLHIAIGYLPNKKTNYSIFLDGTDDTKTNYVISKNINDFLIDFKLTSHLMRPEEYEEASFNLRRKF